jgi:hypothetical protein
MKINTAHAHALMILILSGDFINLFINLFLTKNPNTNKRMPQTTYTYYFNLVKYDITNKDAKSTLKKELFFLNFQISSKESSLKSAITYNIVAKRNLIGFFCRKL